MTMPESVPGFPVPGTTPERRPTPQAPEAPEAYRGDMLTALAGRFPDADHLLRHDVVHGLVLTLTMDGRAFDVTATSVGTYWLLRGGALGSVRLATGDIGLAAGALRRHVEAGRRVVGHGQGSA